jgi:phosphatidylserine/phosphatidylglycerophosphate/cardiolipin synthase-like enzyme
LQLLKPKQEAEFSEWLNAFNRACKPQFRFTSFSPLERNVRCQWFVAGKPTYLAMLTAIRNATKEIFISVWA